MNNPTKKILVVDDDEKILYAFCEVMKKDNYTCITARDGEEALQKLSENPDLVYLDIAMPKIDGLETLRRIKQKNSNLPVIIITGYGTMQTAIKAMQYDAYEYITKPLDIEKIRTFTRKAVESAERPVQKSRLNYQLKADLTDRYELIGNSYQIQEIFKTIGIVSTTPHEVPVLITGESGTGKELVARAIHDNGPNNEEPFIAINCAAVPETLLESELFGHAKGAFTGATERKTGKFETAGSGTIFLDEIGNLSQHLQQKLLRAIQEREYERIGENTPIKINARFIAATNKDIENEVREGTFREDLYFRLNVVSVKLPPLRERKEDIPLLANYFLTKYNERLNKSVKGFNDEAMRLLMSYSFPGNVRELENIVERAVMFTKRDIILPDVLNGLFSSEQQESHSVPIVSPVFQQARKHVLDIFEKQFITELLQKHRGNVSRAADTSNMTRQNFIRLMNKHGIKSKDFR